MRLGKSVQLAVALLAFADLSGTAWAQESNVQQSSPESEPLKPKVRVEKRVASTGESNAGTTAAVSQKRTTSVSGSADSGSGQASSARAPKPGDGGAPRTATSIESERRPSRVSSETKPAKSARRSMKTPARSTGAPSTNDARKGSKESKPDSTQSDPELVAIERAEKALFPWALRGIRTGYAFDEPFADQSSAADLQRSNSMQWLRDLTLPATFPNIDGRIVTYLEFYRSTPEGKTVLRTWAKKRGRYQSAITSILVKAGLPAELVWQSMVESGHNPTIRSPAGAAGLWQFMPETAKAYGLAVDRWVDERLDPESSTFAASRMMSELFQRFGNWELALAAYNMGDAGLLRAIRKYNTNDFWVLSRYEAGIPRETALYVPRVIALSVAMLNPDAFGIGDITPDEPIQFDSVSLAPGQLLSTVARVIGVADDELVRFNPHLLAQRVPPSLGSEKTMGRVFLPKGKASLVHARIGRLSGLEPDLMPYTVKAGETLDGIADVRGVTLENLRTINRILPDERVEAGMLVLVPRQASEAVESKPSEEDRVAVVPANSGTPSGLRRVFYRTKNGDSLSSIAETFKVSRADLLAWNAIDPSARLQARMLMQLFVAPDYPTEGLGVLQENQLTILVAGSPEFGDYFEGLRGNERIVVQVKQKDTLASIGARYGVSVGMMERINRRSRRDALVPGESIVVYTRRNGSSERLSAAR